MDRNMNIMVHMRPGEKDFYVRLVKMAYPHTKIITISDIKNVGDIWIGDFIYQKESLEQYFSDEILEDIRLRCRFLRNIEKGLAYKLINNLAYGLNQLFSGSHIDAVVGGLIDCYTQDVLERITKEHNKPYVSFVGHFFSGYCRISSRGELRKMPRSVSRVEIEEVLSQVTQESYKPGFKLNNPRSIKQMLYFYGRELIKKHVYFPIRKTVENDYLNYHYNTTLPSGWTLSSVISKYIDRYFSTLNVLPAKYYNDCVYMPLHFTPEATIDYWADDPTFALQEETIIKVAAHTPSHIKLLIKEHPAMYLRRNTEFYEKLRSFSNVTLIHPYECSNSLLNRVENVLVFTGSVGVEALLRNKRVLTLTNNYYSDLHPNIFKTFKLTDEDLAKELQKYPQGQFIHDILQGLFKARFYNDKSMFNSDTESMSRNLKEYLTCTLQGGNI